jgi:hypothetical protein
MPFFKRFFVLFLGLLVWGKAFPQKRHNDAVTRMYSPAELKADALVLKNVIMKMHPVVGIYMPRAFYNSLFDEYIKSLNDSLTEKQFRIRTKMVLDELHCGHTEVISSRAYVRIMGKQYSGFSPYLFLPIQDKVYVLAVADRKKDTLMKRGTEITRINGIPADSMLMFCRKMITTDGYNSTGKTHYLKLGFNSYYPAIFGRPDTFEVEYKTGGVTKTAKYSTIRIRNLPSIPLMPKDDSLFTVYKKSRMKYRFLDTSNKTMLLRVQSFSRKKFKRSYRKIFRKLEKNKTENLVIDLRFNGGGSLENSYRLLSYVLDTTATQTLKTGIKKYPYKQYTNGNIWFKLMRFGFGFIAKKKTVNDTDYYVYKINPRKKYHYNNKIYVLINGGSFSAACLVAAYLKHDGRATFIGEETSGAMEGCNAGITPYYRLPNTHVRIRVPAFRIVHDVSPQITGHGIIPDYKVDYSINDILMRKDLELQKVKELIKN